ncbi:MAG: glycoside hydrolase family 38 C-terminal domain-containing protein [Verrucomicrobiia bacterium]
MNRRMLHFAITIVAMVACGQTWAEPAAKQPAEPKLTVVNASSHCDWCWGHTRLWHEQRYAEIIRQVLVLMRSHPRYVWLLENVSEELAPFLERAGREWPEMIAEFWQRVREGRIEMIGAVSNPRLTEVYPETMVRNLVLGQEYFHRNAPGAALNVYNAVDLMCGPSQMPQILTKAGYRQFMFSRPVGPQVVFRRKGLDGTRMLSARCFYGYNAMGKYDEPVKGFLPSPIWRLAIGGDDVLPDPKLLQEAATWDSKKKILATNSRYFEEVEKCDAPITELQGPLDSLECYVEAGLHGDRSLYMQNNQDEDLLLCLEKAQVMALGTCEPMERGAVDRLWRDVLSCTGHAIQWAWTVDYEERMAFARHRRVRIEQALHEALSAIAGKIGFRAGLGSPLVVFNFHAWPVTGPAEFTVEGDTTSLTLRDGAGKEIPIQFASLQQITFIAETVPACGYKTFYLGRSTNAVTATANFSRGTGPIENDRYRARMRSDGALEVFDKVHQTPLGSAELGGLGDIVYYDAPPPKHWEMSGPLGPMHRWTTKENDLQLVQGPVFAALRAKGTFGAHSAVRELRLWRDDRRLDYHVELDAAESNGVFAIRFPTGMTGRVFAGIPFGAEPRENFDKEPFRGEFFVKGYTNGFCATRWADVSSSASGFTFICPPGAHTGYAFDRANQTLEFLLLRVRPLTPGLWGQMHPSIKGTGHHVFDCALVPHAGTWREATSHRDAMESHVPLLAFSPDLGLRRARAGRAPANKTATLDDGVSFAEVGPANVVLSSLRLVGQEVELRLYEATGQQTEASVRLRQPVESVQETDFLGKPTHDIGKIEIRDGVIRFKLPPWKIANLRVQLKK